MGRLGIEVYLCVMPVPPLFSPAKPMDVVAFGAHPDDVELSAGGTLAKLASEGKRCAVVDLTRGELGTRGSAEVRDTEASESAAILGLGHRENLGLADGFLAVAAEALQLGVSVIRRLRPTIVLANALEDRHPDHGRGAELVARAAFLSGLSKIKTGSAKLRENAWRPKAVYHYIQDHDRKPDVVMDITGHLDTKFHAIMAFKSQFHDPSSKEPSTPISSPEFLDHVRGRATSFGRPAGFLHGEGFEVRRPVGVGSLLELM